LFSEVHDDAVPEQRLNNLYCTSRKQLSYYSQSSFDPMSTPTASPDPVRKLVIGTTTPEVAPGGIPTFLSLMKGDADYSRATFMEWGPDPRSPWSLGEFHRGKWARMLQAQWRVTWAARRFDLIEVHSIRTGLAALLLYRSKCSFFYHGPGFQEAAVEGASPLKVAVIYVFESVLLAGLQGYRTATQAFRRRLIENHGVPGNRIEVVRPKIEFDTQRIRTMLSAKLTLTRKNGLVRAVICRRMVRRVGIVEFLNAFRNVRGQNVRIDVIGKGPISEEVEAICARDPRVHFHGAISDERRDEIYAAAVFNILPTVHLEGLGMAIYEGLRQGTIPLVSNCDGMPEVIEEIGWGRYFNDAHAIARAITLEEASFHLLQLARPGIEST
jgi:glycosyltransferase involved in cell wall biosynthesis